LRNPIARRLQGGGDPVLDLGLRKAQVPRAEGNILLYARTKELVVRVLEDHAISR
jgi:hypothetical protein